MHVAKRNWVSPFDCDACDNFGKSLWSMRVVNSNKLCWNCKRNEIHVDGKLPQEVMDEIKDDIRKEKQLSIRRASMRMKWQTEGPF